MHLFARFLDADIRERPGDDTLDLFGVLLR